MRGGRPVRPDRRPDAGALAGAIVCAAAAGRSRTIERSDIHQPPVHNPLVHFDFDRLVRPARSSGQSSALSDLDHLLDRIRGASGSDWRSLGMDKPLERLSNLPSETNIADHFARWTRPLARQRHAVGLRPVCTGRPRARRPRPPGYRGCRLLAGHLPRLPAVWRGGLAGARRVLHHPPAPLRQPRRFPT